MWVFTIRLGPLLGFSTGPRFRGTAFLRGSCLSASFEEFFGVDSKGTKSVSGVQ
jgi:hypothetical protein